MDHFLIFLLAGVTEVVTVPDNELTLLRTLDFFFSFLRKSRERKERAEIIVGEAITGAELMCEI